MVATIYVIQHLLAIRFPPAIQFLPAIRFSPGIRFHKPTFGVSVNNIRHWLMFYGIGYVWILEQAADASFY